MLVIMNQVCAIVTQRFSWLGRFLGWLTQGFALLTDTPQRCGAARELSEDSC